MGLALIIIDMQKALARDGAASAAPVRAAAPLLAEAAGWFRAAARPVVYVQDEDFRDAFGDDGFALLPELRAESGDLRVAKRFGNAFWQTSLEAELRSRGVDFLLIGGYAAEECVLKTYFGARERDFRAATLIGGIASDDPAMVDVLHRLAHGCTSLVARELVQR